MLTNCTLTACLCLTIWQSSSLRADEPPARLHLDISAWLQRQPKNDDSWKGRKEFPYEVFISNAGADPKLLAFVTRLRRFTKIQSSGWPGTEGDYLERLVIENTTLTPDQARQLEPIVTEELTISNCDISDEVAQSLGKIRVTSSLTFKQLRMSGQALASLARIECSSLNLKQLQMSNEALSGFLASKLLRTMEAEDIRGCTADGWRGLSNQLDVELRLTNCDFDDQALLHLSSSRCRILNVKNGQLTGSTLGALKTLKDCLLSLSFSGCPINDQGIQSLPELSKLSTLDLSKTRVSNEGLQALPVFSKLTKLDLNETVVTNEGFRNFKVPPSLQTINVAGTKVTQAWGLEISRQHQEDGRELRVYFHNDTRWPPYGGYCERGEFHFYK